MPPGVNPNALVATIDAVILFDERVALVPQIPNYDGRPLYITHLTPGAGNTLTITIDDIGPPVSVANLGSTPASAVALVSYKGSRRSTSATTTQPITYGGKPLVLTAAVTPPAGGGKWTNATLAPHVAEWALSPKHHGIEFVIRHDVDGTVGQLWWLVNPTDSYPLSQTSVFIVDPPGGGVQGPFGLGNP